MSCGHLESPPLVSGARSLPVGATYSVKLGDALQCGLHAGPGTEGWLALFADIIRVQRSTLLGRPTIRFVERGRAKRFSSGFSSRDGQGVLDRLPGKDWHWKKLDLARFWYHPVSAETICEIRWWDNPATNFASMADATCVLYHALAAHGAVPLHAALLVSCGQGVLLLADGGVGKTTCCLRVPEPWKWLCDDETLVVPSSRGRLWAHPLPTWSDLVRGSCVSTNRSVERGVPLSAIFFLSQASQDEVFALGRGAAAARMMSMTLRYFTRPHWESSHPDDDIALRKQVFANVCSVTSQVSAYELRVAREGRFWKEIECVLPGRDESLE
ncbi:MAG: SynChlorMet cassette protein ScmC [Desulfomonile sp.]|nr:SynChlorMet cassette protein ScmC [Desulfomonile sp.]